MTDPDLIERLSAIPLYAELDAGERTELAGAMRQRSFADGEVLMHQGAEPDGAYFIVSGQVKVVTKLPGGGETMIAEPGPGSTLGELALIRSGRRSATVRAAGPVAAIFTDRRYFQAAVAQLRPGALKVLRRLALLLSQRLLVLHGQIREAVAGDERAYAPLALSPEAPPRPTAPGFDVAAFLPILPCFRDFDAADIEALRVRARVLAPPRGSLLRTGGAPPETCYVVVRGAVASGFLEAGRMHQLNVLGPGRFCAVGPLLAERPMSASYVVREDAVLLEIARQPFLELIGGGDQTALMLLTAVNEHQATMVARASNHLTRLVGLSRLRRQLEAGTGISV